jgi:hypothetical protein
MAATCARAADYRDTPQSKLDAAKEFVSDFLERDALPTEVFFHRKVTFPAWNDSPMLDCELGSFVRAIEVRGEPVFEDTTERIVKVPVVAELLLVDAGEAGGPDAHGGVEESSWCTFEYERYNFKTKRFEKLPKFRKHTLNIEFKTWGEVLPKWRSHPLPPGLEDDRYVAIDLNKRYVRYTIRVNVTREQPYRIWPQVPRHWYAKDAISKLEKSIARTEELLLHRISDQRTAATGPQLIADLEIMQHQNAERRWRVERLQDRLKKLEPIAPFSDLQNH